MRPPKDKNGKDKTMRPPKDKNGMEIEYRARVRGPDGREGTVYDTEAGAGLHMSMIGVRWDGDDADSFVADRDVEVWP